MNEPSLIIGYGTIILCLIWATNFHIKKSTDEILEEFKKLNNERKD